MRQKSKRLTQVLVLVLTIVALMAGQSAWAQFSGGNGSQGDPYIISSPADLNQLASDVNNGESYAGKYFKLDANIAYDPDAENNFTPIGTSDKTSDKPFMGTFLGNGHKITGININSTEVNDVGLFGVVSGATLDGITVSGTVVSTGNNTGGLIGRVTGDNVTISNCVSSTEVIAGAYTGGFIGYIDGHNVVISNCRADGYVSGNGYVDVNGKSYGNVGGFVGGINGSGTVTVTSCVARGDVRSTYTNYAGFIGWVNDANATISNCWCSGAVWGKGGNLGAFVGCTLPKNSDGTRADNFEDCSVYPYGSGPRYACGSDTSLVARIISATEYADMTNGWPEVKKHSHGLTPIATAEEFLAIAADSTNFGCYVLVDDIDFGGQTIEPIGTATAPFTGEFYGQGHRITDYTVETSEPFAGLFGNIAGGRVNGVLAEEGTVSRTGNVNTTVGVGGFAGVIQSKSLVDDCSFTGNVQNDATGKNGGFGGFVGRTDDLPAILRCCAEVEAVDNYSSQPNTGGFVGDHGHGYIVDAYAIGPVTDHYLNPPHTNVGGFAGYVGPVARIANAWCSGEVSSQGPFLGAFVGQAHVDGRFTNSYYDNNPNSGMMSAAGTSSVSSTDRTGITGVDDMSDPDNFQGFDFVATWTIGENTGLPAFLRGQQHVTFDPAGGTCEMESHDYAIGYDYDGDNDANDGLPEPVRPGYSFLGWFDDLGILVTDDSIVTFDTNRTLHAQWTPSDNINLTANEHNGNYWTTFYSSEAGYKINDEENACAYTATYTATLEGSTLKLHKLGKVIPAGTAVIIVGEDNSIGLTASSEEAEYTVGNDLLGVDVPTLRTELGTGTVYVMGKVDDNFGFFQYTADYMPAHKAYLLASSSGSVKGFKMEFEEDDATSLSEELRIKNEESVAAKAWHTLDGRKLNSKPTQRGIYIHNGRKEVLK